MGKAYVSRKPKEEQRKSDLFETPKCLTWKLLETGEFDYSKTILDPACGRGAISNILSEKKYFGYGNIVSRDILTTPCNLRSVDFLKMDPKEKQYSYITTNPPFSKFDDFVMKAKEIATEKFAFIGKTNFFGAYQRYEKGVWKHLKHVYIFNRQVDYQGSIHPEGLCHVGNLVTGWFVWDMRWDRSFWKTSVIDVQQYAKLGQYKEI